MFDVPKISLVQLQRFLAVAEELHFTRAAERLNVSQPLLSAQMRDLEDNIGARLFERTSRKVELSEAGAMLRQRAKDVLNAAHNAVAATLEIANGRNAPIRIGYTDEFSRQLVPDLVRLLKEDSPAVVHLVLGAVPRLVKDVADGVLDLAFLCPLPAHVDPAWLLQPLPDLELTVGIRKDHPLACEPRLTIDQIAELPFVASTASEAGSEQLADRLFAEKGLRRTIAQRSDDPHMMNSLAAAGVGVLLATRTDFAPYPELAAIPLDPPVRLRCGAVSRSLSESVLLNKARSAISVAPRSTDLTAGA